MIPVAIRLKFAATPQRPVAAWLVRGSMAEDWLSAAAACPGDPYSLRILPLAEDGAMSPTAALLVWGKTAIPPSPMAGFGAETDHPLMHGYGFAAERVLVPVEAVVEPPLTADEWRQAFPDADALFAWHPLQGLVRFDPADQQTIVDLLTGPPEQPADWTAARTAPAFVDRLWSVVSTEPVPTLADVEAEWQQELKTRRPLGGLPSSPGESTITWTERMALATAKFRLWLRRWFQGTPSARRNWPKLSSEAVSFLLTAAFLVLLVIVLQWVDPLIILMVIGLLWLLFQGIKGFAGSGREAPNDRPASNTGRATRSQPSRLGTWFRKVWERLTKLRNASPGSWLQRADQSVRRREIDRLLHMLDQQPDEGLRYAIPFGGDPGRGRGVVGNELVRRDLSFGLFSGGGGGPTDWWDIDPLQQLKLQQRYRELAEREQQSGRHRRAAYVYSQLLGDWQSAATALRAGHFYAEAAVIYHDRLHNLPQAAICYELAGQPDEALRIYRDEKLWTVAGDLCDKLGRSDEAKECYLSAVEHWRATGDIRSAADVLETKLHDVDSALGELERTWPGHHGADSYFDLWFTVAARHHRHSQAAGRIQKLAGENSASSTLKLLPRLQQVRITYPEAAVQHLAKESTLRLVSQQLPDANPAETRQLAAFLPGLSPQDRLLPRDCQRYVDRRKSEEQTPPRKLPAKPQLRLDRQFKLPAITCLEFVQACSAGWMTLVDNTDANSQILKLITWEGIVQDFASLQTSMPGANTSHETVWLPFCRFFLHLDWSSTTGNPHVTHPSFIPHHWLAVKPMPSGLTHVLWIDNIGAAWLTTYTAEGATAKSLRFAEEWLIDPATVTVLLRDRSAIFPVGDDNLLAVLPVGDDELVGECFDAEGVRVWSGVISGKRVIGPSAHGSMQMLVLRDNGVSLLDDIRMPGEGHVVLTGWSRPQAAFLPGGLIAIADDQTLTVLNAADGKSVMSTNHTGATTLAVAPVGIGRFSILRDNGEVEMWMW